MRRIAVFIGFATVLCAGRPEYADPSACAECHADIANAYSKTGMARSFRAAGVNTRLAELESGGFDHEASRDRFSALRHDGKYYVRREQLNAAGQAANAREVAVDYSIGSGERAISYLHRTLDNKLVEFPVTWYAGSGRLGMSPAYDRTDHAGFSRAISLRCMFCHNGYPDVAPGAGNWEGASIFPTALPEGIDCQRCHGPGAAHVGGAKGGAALAAVRGAIVNPARLSRERQMEVCMQCHLETTSLQLPGVMTLFGRDVFSYRPGEPLRDYAVYFDHAPGTGHDDKFELVSSAYRLRKSRCFTESGRLTCTNCHDPHRAVSREEALQKTRSVCLGCHGAAMAALVAKGRHPAEAECATCHMPRRQGADAIHITVTDHFIQRPGKSAIAPPAVEEHDGNTSRYSGEVVAYYPKDADPLYTALAQVTGQANVPGGMRKLDTLLAGSKAGAAWFAAGESWFGAGQVGKALPYYREALRLEPGNWRFLHGVAQALQVSGNGVEATALLLRAIALAPYETDLLQGLGVAYASEGRIAEAVKTFRDAVRRNPEDAVAQNNLGQALIRAGDLKGAEAAFREAVRLEPETWAAGKSTR